jgi:hypothetical protein
MQAAAQDGPEIVEDYKSYQPPVHGADIIRGLVQCVPSEYLHALSAVVITNSAALSHKRRREKTWHRKRQFRVAACLGTYHQKWQGSPAWIEIFVDNLAASCPKSFLRIPPLRDFVFAHVFYHELGHHIHKVLHPEYREREDVADKWRGYLIRLFFERKYWYLAPLTAPLSLAQWLMRVTRLDKKLEESLNN